MVTTIWLICTILFEDYKPPFHKVGLFYWPTANFLLLSFQHHLFWTADVEPKKVRADDEWSNTHTCVLFFWRRGVYFIQIVIQMCYFTICMAIFKFFFIDGIFFYVTAAYKITFNMLFWHLSLIQDNLTCAVKFSRTVSVSFWLCANSSLSSIIFWFRWEICCSRWEILSLQVDLISVSCCLVSSSFFSRVLLCPIQYSF